MSQRRIAIACQGGGSQCAFVAGALKTLLARDVHRSFRIVGLSGTSGGAITAAVAWTALLEQAHGLGTNVGERIAALWRDLSAQTPQEVLFDKICTQSVRLVESGRIPSVAMSPSSPQFQMWGQAAAHLLGRPEFTDLRALLVKHIDFEALPSLVDADSPALLVGACDILEGTFKIFSSLQGEIRVESLLASAAVPNLFPAVWVEGHAYWDGIFSSNPPIFGLLQRKYIGHDMIPEEIWIIQVNPSRFEFVPENPSDIFDRRNHLAGNLSLSHELQLIEMINLLLQDGALTDHFRARFGFETTEGIKVRFIRMSEPLLKSLDYPSKLSREPHQISRLMADGEAQAHAFLDGLVETEHPEFWAGETAAPSH